MSPRILSLASDATALGCVLVAGALFAFSSFVMPALARLPPAHGIAAMQSINVVALHRPFMAAFLGTAAACVILVIVSTIGQRGAADYLRIAGALTYLVGIIGITGACNVPLNNAIAALVPDAAGTAERWRDYVASWMAWNHVRCVAGVIAAAALMASTRGVRP